MFSSIIGSSFKGNFNFSLCENSKRYNIESWDSSDSNK